MTFLALRMVSDKSPVAKKDSNRCLVSCAKGQVLLQSDVVSSPLLIEAY